VRGGLPTLAIKHPAGPTAGVNHPSSLVLG
jgi:hypothetical protein